MVRVLFLTLLISASAQAQELYLKDGLLKASATITPSDMLASEQNNFYISGFLEYHMTKKTSFRGETFMFVDGKVPEGLRPINGGMRTFFSAQYHSSKNNFDYSLGAGPGLSVMRVLDGDPDWIYIVSPYKTKYIPSFIVQTGVSYYVGKYFHFFANISYVATPATHLYMGDKNRINNLDEVMVSAGLGFQLPTKK